MELEMTTLLTFLGTIDYSPTTYVLGSQCHTSRYRPAAEALPEELAQLLLAEET